MRAPFDEVETDRGLRFPLAFYLGQPVPDDPPTIPKLATDSSCDVEAETLRDLLRFVPAAESSGPIA